MFVPQFSLFVVPLRLSSPLVSTLSTGIFLSAVLHTLIHIPGVTRVQVKNTHLWQVQINFAMTIRDDACAHIIQAAGCAAAWILENEEVEAKNALSRAAGRIARPRQRRLVHEVYMSLGDFYFRRAYRMSYELFRNLHKLLATGINRARLKLRRYIVKGGKWTNFDKCSSRLCSSILCWGFTI